VTVAPTIIGSMITPQERAMLDYEDTHPRNTGQKEDHMRDEFGLYVARYYQRIDTLLERPDVIAEWPQLAKRRLRAREAGEQKRAAISRARRS
jgi:hypothetical protein